MKVTIEITCEDEKDIMTHLTVIRQQIRDGLKHRAGEKELTFEDGNTFGEHTVKIQIGER